jgi:hypothetical protein
VSSPFIRLASDILEVNGVELLVTGTDLRVAGVPENVAHGKRRVVCLEMNDPGAKCSLPELWKRWFTAKQGWLTVKHERLR